MFYNISICLEIEKINHLWYYFEYLEAFILVFLFNYRSMNSFYLFILIRNYQLNYDILPSSYTSALSKLINLPILFKIIVSIL